MKLKDKLNKTITYQEFDDEDVIEVEIDSTLQSFAFLGEKGTYEEIGPGKHTVKVLAKELPYLLRKVEEEPDLVDEAKKKVATDMKLLEEKVRKENRNAPGLEQEIHDAKVIAVIRDAKTWQAEFQRRNGRGAKGLNRVTYLRNLGLMKSDRNENRRNQTRAIKAEERNAELMEQNAKLLEMLAAKEKGKKE